MRERWRRPIKVLSVEPSEDAFVTSDGRLQRGVDLVLDPESVERIRLGYACLKCLEPFPVAWPIRCHVCGAPVAREQRAFFEREFREGTVDLGPSTSISDELERLRTGDFEEMKNGDRLD